MLAHGAILILSSHYAVRHWDLAAERYAVAVTLYEMLTGTVPVWGDGRSDAALLDCEATIDEDRFDPQLRDGLSDFFGKAFRRDPKERFDNAEEMLRGWRHVFDRAHLTSIEAHEFSAIARAATANTSVRELGYSVEALNVLDRMGICQCRKERQHGGDSADRRQSHHNREQLQPHQLPALPVIEKMPQSEQYRHAHSHSPIK